jgi:hypothetical protein
VWGVANISRSLFGHLQRETIFNVRVSFLDTIQIRHLLLLFVGPSPSCCPKKIILSSEKCVVGSF